MIINNSSSSPSSFKSKTSGNNPKLPTSSPLLPFTLAYDTLIIEKNKDTVGNTYRCLEENVKILKIITVKSFIEDQL